MAKYTWREFMKVAESTDNVHKRPFYFSYSVCSHVACLNAPAPQRSVFSLALSLTYYFPCIFHREEFQTCSPMSGQWHGIIQGKSLPCCTFCRNWPQAGICWDKERYCFIHFDTSQLNFKFLCSDLMSPWEWMVCLLNPKEVTCLYYFLKQSKNIQIFCLSKIVM